MVRLIDKRHAASSFHLARSRGLSRQVQGDPDSDRLDRAAWPQRPARHRCALCPEIIGKRAGDEAGILDRPDLQCRPGAASYGFRRHDHAAALDHDRGDDGLGAVADAPRFRAHLLAQRPWRQYRHDHGGFFRDVSRHHLQRCRLQPPAAALHACATGGSCRA